MVFLNLGKRGAFATRTNITMEDLEKEITDAVDKSTTFTTWTEHVPAPSTINLRQNLSLIEGVNSSPKPNRVMLEDLSNLQPGQSLLLLVRSTKRKKIVTPIRDAVAA